MSHTSTFAEELFSSWKQSHVQERPKQLLGGGLLQRASRPKLYVIKTHKRQILDIANISRHLWPMFYQMQQ